LCLLAGPAVAQQEATEWAKMPRMQLERQFAGPLRDTIIQRWRDPGDGTVCYIYLPISAQHSQPAGGYVHYGPNTIGSISCAPSPAPPSAPARVPAPPSKGGSEKR
jgi:hypothetical protein